MPFYKIFPDTRPWLFFTVPGGYVEDDGGGEDGSTDDVLERNVGSEKVHAIHEGCVDKGTNEGAGDFTDASCSGDAAYVAGGYRIHFKELAGLGGG